MPAGRDKKSAHSSNMIVFKLFKVIYLLGFVGEDSHFLRN